jgi:hypothetical protein
MRVQQGLDFVQEFLIFAAGVTEKRGALGLLEVQGLAI